MAFNINEFMAEISQSGVSKSSHYSVIFTPPPDMYYLRINGVTSFETLRKIELRAEEVRLPGISYATSDNNIYGPGPFRKMAFNVAFTEIPMVFLADKNGEIYKFFYAWVNRIINFAGPGGNANIDNASYDVGYRNNVSTTIDINVYDQYGKIQFVLKLFGAFPVSINEIPMSWNQQNELMKLAMSFTFTHWKLDNINYSVPTNRGE